MSDFLLNPLLKEAMYQLVRQNNFFDYDKLNLCVSIPLHDYMKLRGIKNKQKALKQAEKDLKEEWSFRFDVQWKNKGSGSCRLVNQVGIDEREQIHIHFTQTFVQTFFEPMTHIAERLREDDAFHTEEAMKWPEKANTTTVK